MDFKWNVEIHYSQGKDKAKVFSPTLEIIDLPEMYHAGIKKFMSHVRELIPEMNKFQEIYCMTTEDRKRQPWVGPYELLDFVKNHINATIGSQEQKKMLLIKEEPFHLPLATAVGYFILSNIFNN